MKRLFVLMFFACLLGNSGCSDQSECCTNNFLSIDVVLQNTTGDDMLNSSRADHIAKQDISVFYEIGGKLETYVSLNEGSILDNPEGFALQSDGTNNFLHVFSNPTIGNNVVTLIRIKNRPDIRLITQVESNHGRQITSLWHDDELVWSNTMSSRYSPYVVVELD